MLSTAVVAEQVAQSAATGPPPEMVYTGVITGAAAPKTTDGLEAVMVSVGVPLTITGTVSETLPANCAVPVPP